MLFGISSKPVFATYNATITTSSSISLNATYLGTGVSVHDESVTVTTNCSAGYNLNLATTSDNTLYLNGDTTNNTSTITAIDDTYALSDLTHNANTWGFSLTGDTDTAGDFAALSTTPTTIKTISETASATDIEDVFSVYYGTAINSGLNPGSYSMSNSGVIAYYLTISPSCVDSAVVTFNENLDGQGGEGTDSTLANFPTSSDNTTDTTNNTITLSNKRPTRDGYIFKEWNTSADGTGDYYYVGETVPMGQDGLSGFVTLYAIWVANCPADTICYDGNHADHGTMANQTATSNANNNLLPSNFDRSDYGYAGWNTEADATGTNYGPGQTLNPGDLSTTGLTLFAHWIEASGIFQKWANPSSLSIGDVIALRDDRDDEVYAVARLADNNIWIIENLRLVPGTANITAKNTNNPTASFVQNAPGTVSTTTQCSTNGATCDDNIYFYTGNMDRNVNPLPTGNTSANYWYSYGAMYNWYTATAGNGTYSQASGNVAGDICPAGWHIPTGGSGGEYPAFVTAIGGTGSTGATNIRKYPNNFIWSGDYNPSSVIPDGRGTQARLWEGTASSNSNAYRMGFNSSSITPNNTYNKWDNFAVRCIYQGGKIIYDEVTVDFEGTGITSVTFENNNLPTETATPASPTVNLAEEVAYTATAITATGYELTSWATTANGTLTSTSTNPTSYTVTDDATLTVTGNEIPSYTITVNMGEHVTGITFINPDFGTISLTPASASCTDNNNDTYTCTVSLRRGISYDLTSSYEASYTVDAWTTTAGGTLSSTTAASTTYTVTSATTLSLTAQEADELTYILTYSAGSGTDAPGQDTLISYNATESFTVTNSAPIYYGYTLTGWSETADANNDGTTVDYVAGDTITINSTGTETTKTLYPVYAAITSCPANKICYYDNGADVNGGGRGTMANQTASSSTSAKLIPTNYSKSGYGFAGWTTAENATPYGPNATITTPDISSSGLVLYAKWVASTGTLQSWTGCNAMSTNSVIALTDIRDDNAYAVAKLADGNCWTIENLRLVPNTATITSQDTHNPANGFAAEAANSSSSNALCNTDDDSSCVNQLQYNTNSLNRSLTQSYNTAGSNVAWYSYGVYYNWYTATAGNGTFSTSANTNVNGDLCPKNWHLPTSTSSGEWAALNTAVNGGVSNADAGLRTYPVNLIWSGDYNGSSRTSGYSNGRYWSSTGLDANNAYRMGHQESGSKGSTPSGNYRKWDGFAIRCIRDEVVEYNDVVVTFPANVTSVSFTNAQHGIEIATPQNTTASLVQGVTYTLTATFASGYTIDTWTNGSNSTIGSVSANPTTFSVTDDSTLTLSTTTFSCNPSATTISATVCLQDMNSNIINSMADSTTYQLYDARDWQQYNIAKLADGNVWMTENLNIAGGTALSSTDTDFDSSYTLPTTDGWTVTDGKLVLPASDTSGFSTLDYAYVYNSGNKTSNCVSPGCYSYYSWDAATLGSGRSISTDNTDAGYSICPKGWKLPTSRTTSATNWQTESDFYVLAHQYGLDSTTQTNEEDNDFHTHAGPGTTPNFLLAGSYYGGSFYDGDSIGYFWSATSLSGSAARGLYFYSDYVNSVGNYNRRYGFSVRCLSKLPTHSVTISPDSHISSVTFSASGETTQTATSSNLTVSLKEGKSYTITATTDTGYEFASWSTTANGTLGSTTTNPTTYTVTDTATITVASQEICSTVAANSICYMPNGNNVEGTMGIQTFSASDTSVTLLASNFSRSGYGFAGWSPDSTVTGSSKIYGPQEDLTMTAGQYNNAGLKLYAVWVQSAGSMQSDYWNVCKTLTTAPTDGTANLASVSALTDARDNETYAIAKLADGNCWMIENLRLESTNSDNSTGALAQGYGTSDAYGNFAGLANPESTGFYYEYSANSVYYGGNQMGTATINIGATDRPGVRMPRYNNLNTPVNVNDRPQNPTSNTFLEDNTTVGIYSYGNYYTWPAAIADTAVHTSNNTSITNTSICSFGWHLPKGGDKTNEANSEFWSLIVTGINGGTNPANYSTTNPYYTGNPEGSDTSNKLRAFPNNFLYSGRFTASSAKNRGSSGSYWSSTMRLRGESYTLFLNSTEVVPGTGSSTYNTSYGNAVRCLASAPTHSITISPDSHISSATFSASSETTQTATSASPTVNLKEGKSYTITATADAGYEFASWSTTANGALGSTTTNPTTYTVADTATLTATSQAIPTYTVTVNMDSNVNGITFINNDYGSQSVTTTGSTVTLRRGAPYTVTASFNAGYIIDTWSTGPYGTLSSTSVNPVNYIVTDATTLSLISKEVCSSVVVPANSICYDANGNNVEGTMGAQTITSADTSVTLLASNFSRSGYGFAGWSPDSTVTSSSKIYGPQEDLAFTAGQYSTAGLKLYAVWVQSAGYLQTDAATTCSSLTTAPTDGTANIGSVSALTDQRDNETYAIAKLADGNCWMIENLRLEAEATKGNNQFNPSITNESLAQGYGGQFAGLADSEALWTDRSTAANSLYSIDGANNTINIGASNAAHRFPRYNNINTPSSVSSRPVSPTTNSAINSTSNASIYSYGNYYTWASAIADTTMLSDVSATPTSICPSGWQLPEGGKKINEANNDFWSLIVTNINGGIKPLNYDTEDAPYYTGTQEGSGISAAIRAYPNNFIFSGSIANGSIKSRGAFGYYWSSSGLINNTGYGYASEFAFGSSDVYPGDMYFYSSFGNSIRCIVPVPTHSVIISPDSHISSVTFSASGETTQTATSASPTVNLKEGKSYTITATVDTGYEFASWSTTANGTLGSTTTNPTTYTVTDTATLTVASQEETPQPQAATAGCINYFANASTAEGTMGCQTATDNANITLLASNFSRDGYGFAGWSDAYDYKTNPNAHFYGPQEDITVPVGTTANGLSLYAVWIKSAGSLQDQNKLAELCGAGTGSLAAAPTDGTANLSSVSALTDQRDGETYAIAKLADGKCWMIENLRLEAEDTRTPEKQALAQGYGTSATYGNFSGLADAESTGFTGTYTANSLYYSGTQEGTASIDIGTSNYPAYRMPRYNNLNTANRAQNSPNSNTFSNDNTTGGMYSYGNYYTWHAAIADLTYNGTNNNSTTSTSLCPTGWHLPKGGDKSNEANNELWSLVVDGINGGTKPANYDSETRPYYTGTPEGSDASNKLRAYPNNFLYSGYFGSSSAGNRGSYGLYWSSAVSSLSTSYRLYLGSSSVGPGTSSSNKYSGYSIRCTVSAGTQYNIYNTEEP